MALLPPPPPPACGDAPRAPLAGLGHGARVWLLRHGAVEPEAACFAYGSRDVPLSELGRQQTAELGRRFHRADVSLVVSSPLSRARRLGEAVAEASGSPLIVDAHLAEMDRGDWQGLGLEEYRARWRAQAAAYWGDAWRWSGHGGESDEALTARTWPAFLGALRAGGTVVLAVHFQVLRSIVSAALGLAPARSHALCVETGRGVELVDAPGGIRLERANVLPRCAAAPREAAG